MIELTSLPSRERGLKLQTSTRTGQLQKVAPFAGAWIEITQGHLMRDIFWSLPSRERGLKFVIPSLNIEPQKCRSLRGSVD